MGTFTLGTSTLSGTADTRTRQRLSGFARWFQFRFLHTAQRAMTLLGFDVRVVPAGERRGDS